MDISVIIPTYNRAHVLPRALDSVLSQRLAPREIIVVDDGSDDGTAELIRDRYPQVRYQYQTNHGVSHARNCGITSSEGEWVALLDSDDAWTDNKLTTQQSVLHKDPAYRICHTNETWIRNGKRVNPMNKHAKKGGWIFQDCLPLCAISPSSVLIHRSVFKNVGLFNESLPACEDYDLWLRICSRYPVLYTEDPLVVKYGGQSDQLSRQHWGMDRFRIQALEEIIQSGALKETDRIAATKMLLKKSNILLIGARKRHNRSLMQHCESILSRYPLHSEAPDLGPENLP